MEEGKLHNQGRKLLFSELFKGVAKNNLPSTTASDAGKHTKAGSISTDFWSSGSSISVTTPCSVLRSELSSITTDSEDECNTDLISELNRQMAEYMLQDDDEILFGNPSFHNFESNKFRNMNQRLLEKEKEFGYCGKKTEWRNEEEEVGGIGGGGGGGGGQRSKPSSEKRDLLQKQILQNGSGMRAVFVGGSGPNNASFGTGVFLPRGITPRKSSDHRRKKSGCSTVLIPARVLQVLQQHHFANSNLIPEIIHTNGLMNRYPFLIGNALPTSNVVSLQQKQQQLGEQHLEVSLPNEWIY